MVFADKILNNRYERGFRVGLERGREEGRKEGLGQVRRERAREEGRREGIQLGRVQERARLEVYRRQVNESYRAGLAPPKAPPEEEFWNGYVCKWIDLGVETKGKSDASG